MAVVWGFSSPTLHTLDGELVVARQASGGFTNEEKRNCEIFCCVR